VPIWRPAPKGCTITLKCKDFTTINVHIQKEREAVLVFQSIQNLLPGYFFFQFLFD